MERKKDFSRIALVILAALGVLSCALFVPSVREAVIALGERIVGRGVNHSVWHRRFVAWEIRTLTVFIFAILLMFLITLKKISLEQCFILMLVILVNVSFIRKHHFGFHDFNGQRNLCAYALRGINPFPIVGTSAAPIAGLGEIRGGWATTPWGLLLGNIFYPGFMSFSAAKIYFVITNIVAICVVALSMLAKLKSRLKHFVLYAVFVVGSYLFWYSVTQGNCGGIVCCLLILAMLWHGEFPVLSGVALAFAMVKPQVAGLVCLAFMLNKRFKPIVIAAAIDLFAWIAASIMVKTSPLQLLIDFFAVNPGNGRSYMGIFTPLAGIIPYKAVLPLSMTAGIVFVVIMHVLQKDRASPLRMFFSACVATTFWCYAWLNDAFVLIVPAFLCLFFMENAEHVRGRIFWFLCTVYFYARNFICGYVLGILHIFIKSEHIWWYQLSLYSLGLIAVSLVMLKKLNGGASHDGARV